MMMRTATSGRRPAGPEAILSPPSSVPPGGLRHRTAALIRRIAGEGATPARLGWAVGVGILIGTSPFFGFHLAICLVVATILGLNRAVTYLAANISGPWLAPFIVFASVQSGHLLITGKWLPMHLDSFRTVDPWSFSEAWILGGVAVGVVLGAPAGVMTFYVLKRYRQAHPVAHDLIGRKMDETVIRYLPQGRRVHRYIAGKFRHDPVYSQIARLAPLPEPIVDLGCGRGQSLLLLRALHPEVTGLGVDHDASRVAIARRAASDLPGLRFEQGDVLNWPIPRAGTVLMIDILHYNPADLQDDLIRRSARALAPGGILLIRDIDNARGARAFVSRMQEHIGRILRMNKGRTLCFRPMAEIIGVLASEGLIAAPVAVTTGVSLGNVLIEARRPAEADP